MSLFSKPFLQLHALTSYPASLLNRDDAGFAKRIPFGGVPRIRISSQCLKYHWRNHSGKHALGSIGIPMSLRSRYLFQHFVFAPLQEEFGLEAAEKATKQLMNWVFGVKSDKKPKSKNDKKAEQADEDLFKTSQIIVLGRVEIDYLLTQGRRLCSGELSLEDKENSKLLLENLKALGKGAVGIDGSMFGRMITNDILARTDAAVHVAHAFTVHAEEVENDYFTAVDAFETLGSAHINQTELNTGLFYTYAVIDLPLLAANLGGQIPVDEMEKKTFIDLIVRNFIHLFTTVTPAAKKGSTAPYNYAHCLLAELGDAQPCSLANAFLNPVSLQDGGLELAMQRLAAEVEAIDKMYNSDNIRACVTRGPSSPLAAIADCVNLPSIDAVAEWCAVQTGAV